MIIANDDMVNQINILRPFVNIPDILAAGKMMKALNPEHVVPGHGTPGTVKSRASRALAALCEDESLGGLVTRTHQEDR